MKILRKQEIVKKQRVATTSGTRTQTLVRPEKTPVEGESVGSFSDDFGASSKIFNPALVPRRP